MRKQMFKKSHYLKITFLLLLLIGWPVVTAHSAVLPVDRQLESALLQERGIDHEVKNVAPLMVLAQNQSGDSMGEPLGEIVFLNTEEDGQSAIVSIESSQPVQYTAFKLLNPLRLILDFPKMGQGNLASRIQVDKGIIDSIRPIHFKEAGVLRLEIVLNQSADYEIKKPEKNKLIVRLQSSEQASGQQMAQSSSNGSTNKSDNDATSTKGEENQDTCFPMLYGEKEAISLDFQNADVRNLFRIFAEISEFNVILSPEVAGAVNIRMMDVPWNQAMDIILTNSNLGRECFGDNIVRIVSKTVLVAEESARIAEKGRIVADKASEMDGQDLVTEVVRIDHANIAELSASLVALKSTREDAKITVDTRTNTLILNDLRKYVDNMLETISVLDVPTAQVLIEAKIVEINKNYAEELGIQWGMRGDLTNIPGTANIQPSANSTSTSVTTQSASNTTGSAVLVPTTTVTQPFMVDLAQTATLAAGTLSGFDLALGSLFRNGLNLNIRLEAIETEGKGRILSSPKITTADNKEARIQSGSRIPYQITSAEGNSVAFIDAELALKVTPHITSDNKVYMSIDATKNSPDFSRLVVGVPTINTKETHTEVLVGNGDTTVLGGIYESSETSSKKQVPFLSQIPLLGLLFQSRGESDIINELLVFITPTIIETN
jgi:type IV pilus assembly protein PilQ